MARLLLLWLSLFLSLAFLFFPHTGEIGFMFSDMILSKKQWAYDFFEHLILVVIGAVILSYETRYKLSAFVFLCIQIADTVDYTLTYGDPWTDGPVTFNTLKCAVFGASIAFDIGKTILNGRRTEIH